MSKYRSNKNKISLDTWRDKVDYVSTACLYCWYGWHLRAGTFTLKHLQNIIRMIAAFFLPQRLMNKYDRNVAYNQPYIDSMYQDLDRGLYIQSARETVYYTYIGFMALPASILCGIILSLMGVDLFFIWIGGLISKFTILMICGLMYIGVNKLTRTFDDSRIYLSYFKKFKKCDREWHKKWKRNSILLFIGATITAATSVVIFIFVF